MNRISNGKRATEWPPTTKTAYFAISTDGGSDTLASPGAGFALEVLAYFITETQYVAMALTTRAKVRFETSGQDLWAGSYPVGAITNYVSVVTAIKVRGNNDEALTITNADVSAGGSTLEVVIFYRTVVV